MTTEVGVEGHVEAGFEKVASAFARNFEDHGEVGAGFCLHVEGRKVVDIWGGVSDQATGSPYDADTLQLVFSTTKGATAACANLLAQRGVIDLDEPVATYWPEFAQQGKGQIPVRWLLSHQAGLPTIDARLTQEEVLAWEPVCAALAAQKPYWEPGTAHGYHALTYGWLVGEVIRRTDGRTPGRFFAEEIAAPLGLEFWIGLPAEQEPRVAPLIAGPLIPALPGVDDLASTMAVRALSLNGALKGAEWANLAVVHAAEIPAANGITNARSVSRLYAALIGTVEGGPPKPILTGEQLDLARTPLTSGADQVFISLGFAMEQKIGLGFWTASPFAPFGGAGSFGHTGAGGSVGFADPENQIAGGYVMNRMLAGVTGDPRSSALIRASYEAVGAPIAFA